MFSTYDDGSFSDHGNGASGVTAINNSEAE